MEMVSLISHCASRKRDRNRRNFDAFAAQTRNAGIGPEGAMPMTMRIIPPQYDISDAPPIQRRILKEWKDNMTGTDTASIWVYAMMTVGIDPLEIISAVMRAYEGNEDYQKEG